MLPVKVNKVVQNRYIWLPLLRLTPPPTIPPRRRGSPGMTSVKCSVNVNRWQRYHMALKYCRKFQPADGARALNRQTDRRQTDGRQHIANVNARMSCLYVFLVWCKVKRRPISHQCSRYGVWDGWRETASSSTMAQIERAHVRSVQL